MEAPTYEQPTARAGLGATVADGKIYVCGGHDGESPVKTLQVFEPGAHVDRTRSSIRRLGHRRSPCKANQRREDREPDRAEQPRRGGPHVRLPARHPHGAGPRRDSLRGQHVLLRALPAFHRLRGLQGLHPALRRGPRSGVPPCRHFCGLHDPGRVPLDGVRRRRRHESDRARAHAGARDHPLPDGGRRRRGARSTAR